MERENHDISVKSTDEKEFVCDLLNKLYNAGSNSGFVLGDFYGLIEKMKSNNISEDVIAEAEEFYNLLDSYLAVFNKEIYSLVKNKWEELGKPELNH